MDLKSTIMLEFKNIFPRFSNRGFHATIGMEMEFAVDLYKLCKTKMAPYEMLLVLNFLKEYRTSAASASSWNMDEGKYLSKFWKCLGFLDECLPPLSLKDRFQNTFPEDHPFHLVLTTVDGILFPRERPREESLRKVLTSGKHKKYGYLYVFVCRAKDGLIVNFYGPHESAGNDLNVIYDSSFFHDRNSWEWTLGDAIFQSFPRILCPRHIKKEYDELDKSISNYRSTIEHIFGRMKSFNILYYPARFHDFKKHELVVRVISKLINLQLENHPIQKDEKPLPNLEVLFK